MLEMGVPKEQLMAMIAQHGQPEGGMSPADMGAKVAADITKFQRSGKFQIREAKTAAERKLRNQMKSYISELLAASHK